MSSRSRGVKVKYDALDGMTLNQAEAHAEKLKVHPSSLWDGYFVILGAETAKATGTSIIQRRDRANARMRRLRKENPEYANASREYDRHYKEANRARLLANYRAYYRKNREAELARKRRWLAENGERKLAYQREWYQKNAETARAYARSRYASMTTEDKARINARRKQRRAEKRANMTST